jgi:DNA polymerase III epsilon subunit family exonuclease
MKTPMKSVLAMCSLLAGLALVAPAPAQAVDSTPGALPRLSAPVKDVTFVVFDTETTGFSAQQDRIVEIGAVKIRNGEIIEEREWLINPGRPIPRRATLVHGITGQMVSRKPSFAEVYPEFVEFAGNAVLVAHNARFDVDMVRAEVERNGLIQMPNVVIDSLKLFRRWYPAAGSYKLSPLAKYVGISGEGFHRGMADSRYAALILFDGLRNHPKCDNLRKLFAASGGMLVF